MDEWISCADKLPPYRKWVILDSVYGKCTAKRIGIFWPQWKLLSGLTEALIRRDRWKELPKEKENG